MENYGFSGLAAPAGNGLPLSQYLNAPRGTTSFFLPGVEAPGPVDDLISPKKIFHEIDHRPGSPAPCVAGSDLDASGLVALFDLIRKQVIHQGAERLRQLAASQLVANGQQRPVP